MSEFVKVAQVSDLKPGEIKLVEADDRLVILFCVAQGQFTLSLIHI